MTFALYGKTFTDSHLEYLKLIIGKLTENGSKVFVWKPFFEYLANNYITGNTLSPFEHHSEIGGNADVMLSVGGDGTLLDAVQLVRETGIPIAGINLGRMGFLSSISRNEILPAIHDILHENYRIERRSLVSIASPEGLFGDVNFGLNEFSINKKDTSSMVVVHVWIDDILLQSYWADGLIIATPTGSTAYSLSCGGPVIAPHASTFVITPIAPHNLTTRPVVIPDSSNIRIRVDGREHQALVCLDSRSAIISSGTELLIRKADFSVNLIQRTNENFISTIRTKLNWGADIRN